MLALHPEAFTSDAESESDKAPADYLHRLGLDRRDGGQFLLGAWRRRRLVGAIGCERDERLKVRHIGKVIGMMVRPEARAPASAPSSSRRASPTRVTPASRR